jgi:hypothetical protein
MAPKINPALLGDPEEPVKVQYDGGDGVPAEFTFYFEQKPYFLKKGKPSKSMTKAAARHFLVRSRLFAFKAQIQVLGLAPVPTGEPEISGTAVPKPRGGAAVPPAAGKRGKGGAAAAPAPASPEDMGAPSEPGAEPSEPGAEPAEPASPEA